MLAIMAAVAMTIMFIVVMPKAMNSDYDDYSDVCFHMLDSYDKFVVFGDDNIRYFNFLFVVKSCFETWGAGQPIGPGWATVKRTEQLFLG